MPITATTNGYAWQDGGPASSRVLVVNKRLVSTTVLSVTSSADFAAIRTAAGADPLQLLSGSFNTTDIRGPMRARAVQVTPVGLTGTIYDAVVTYGTEYVWATPPGGTARWINPIEVTFNSFERVASQYRHAPTTSPAANLNTATDIGGTKRDQEGVPITARIPVVEFSLSIGIDTSQQTLVPIYDNISSMQGCWNSATFLHWSANNLYCVSANVTQIRDEWYRVAYLFRTDRWRDCEQLPDRDQDNYIKLDSNGKAQTVYWRSWERGTFDFNVIFNSTTDVTLAKQIALEGSWLTYP